MCTLIAIYRQVPDRWLVVAANRDEYLDRPAEGPAIRSSASGRVLSPLDVKAGGTWIGMNQSGVFCALTNLSGSQNESDRLSRGEVVTNCLSAPHAVDAAEWLKALPAEQYNSFNCFVCDQDNAFLAVYSDECHVQELGPGVHVVGNSDGLAAPVQKVARLRDRVEGLTESLPDDLLGRLGEVCGEHGVSKVALDETCVHVADTYGTRSSWLLELDDEFGKNHLGGSAESKLFYADGPPCVAPYKNLSPLLKEFEQMPNSQTTEFLTRNAS